MLISDEFEMMHSFLNVSKERGSDEMVRTLVRQVRNMALDVEDCIVLVDMKFHRWWSPLLGWFPSCCSKLAAPPPMDLIDDEAVTAIELLKSRSRVEAMGQRNERYMQIGDCGAPKLSEKTHQQTGADATAGKTCPARLTGRLSEYTYPTTRPVAASSCTPSNSKWRACAWGDHTKYWSWSSSHLLILSVYSSMRY